MRRFVATLLILTALGRASAQACEGIGLKSAFPPIKMEGVTACFLYTKTNKLEKNQLSIDPDGLILYSTSELQEPKLIYEFPYAGTKGEIQDAFIARVDKGGLGCIERLGSRLVQGLACGKSKSGRNVGPMPSDSLLRTSNKTPIRNRF